MIVTLTGVARDEGTVVLFHAEEVDGNPITVAVDHRIAQDLALEVEVSTISVEIEPWQIVARSFVRHSSNRTALS